jgi:glycosyltransferase involved in cell wall biosynthesis
MKRVAVVPAYNEEQTISCVVNRLKKCVSLVLVVDDCSSDETRSNAAQAGACVLSSSLRLGYEKALVKGIAYAVSSGADAILTFDADGQHPYELIEHMFSMVEHGGFDVVVGCRESKPRFSEKVFSAYTGLRYGIFDILCGMKCYSSRAIGQTGLQPGWDSVGSFLVLRALFCNLSVAQVLIPSGERSAGVSRFGLSVKTELKILNAFIRALVNPGG